MPYVEGLLIEREHNLRKRESVVEIDAELARYGIAVDDDGTVSGFPEEIAPESDVPAPPRRANSEVEYLRGLLIEREGYVRESRPSVPDVRRVAAVQGLADVDAELARHGVTVDDDGVVAGLDDDPAAAGDDGEVRTTEADRSKVRTTTRGPKPRKPGEPAPPASRKARRAKRAEAAAAGGTSVDTAPADSGDELVSAGVGADDGGTTAH